MSCLQSGCPAAQCLQYPGAQLGACRPSVDPCLAAINHTLPCRSVASCPVPPQKNTQFGYSRKDVIIIGVGLIGGGYVLYYGLQATGMEPGIAGNWVQVRCC